MSKLNINPGEAHAAQADFLNRVWTDDAFADRLESDPKAVFAEMGSQVGDDVEIRVVRDTEKVKHLHIPAAPWEGEVTDGDLLCAQGGLNSTVVCKFVDGVTVSAMTRISIPVK